MKKLTLFFTDLAERFIPDAFVFAILLSLITIVLGWILGIGSLSQQITSWSQGMWDLNNFAMQMALILITGSTLAKTKLVSRAIDFLSAQATSPIKASILVTLVACVASMLNWGLGLIVGALMATEVARRLKHANYALLLSCGYSGFLLWHGGLSGSIPLKLTDPSGIFSSIVPDAIGLNESLGGGLNILLLSANLITIFVVNIYLTHLFGTQSVGTIPEKVSSKSFDQHPVTTASFAQKIELAKWPIWMIAFLIVSYVLGQLRSGIPLSLNLIIFIFLGMCLFFSANVKEFLSNFNSSVQDSAGILLQFPFYAAIMAVMASSGLAKMLSEFFVSISNEHTFLFFTYISAGVLNFFVPSGGGQWAIQGPIMLPAAQNLGINVTDTAMAIAWGDAWTNMIQPFWALPLLSIAKIKMQKLISYSVVVFLFTGIVSALCFLLWSFYSK